ncbi:hypothetical protein EGI26_10380 [Lacihabitans sp. CCS-44]|uniref:hypothetical protein n=1 Tax=Lacihabitans sp. CCS-44 TaxID=2487331 RepID=UPI0020CFA034|nr:hypothetical protein [Lacihabitans sp. CCS-44]MCP9755562.1 hypothetical protein [Lacihabitans sp. CCS-44]
MDLIKKITGAVLLITVTFKMLMAPLIFADYELRKDFIIKNYCVNKSLPELHCDGKCYLAKQLEKAEQEDKKQATGNFITKLLSFESEIKANLFTDFFLQKPFLVKENPNFIYSEFFSSKNAFSFFHPPQV